MDEDKESGSGSESDEDDEAIVIQQKLQIENALRESQSNFLKH